MATTNFDSIFFVGLIKITYSQIDFIASTATLISSLTYSLNVSFKVDSAIAS